MVWCMHWASWLNNIAVLNRQSQSFGLSVDHTVLPVSQHKWTCCVGIDTMLTMDARLGYTEDVGQLHPNWTEVARSTEDRPLHCSVTKVSSISCDWKCVSSFTGSLYHGGKCLVRLDPLLVAGQLFSFCTLMLLVGSLTCKTVSRIQIQIQNKICKARSGRQGRIWGAGRVEVAKRCRYWRLER